jgi:hypothetical protein
MSVVAVAQQCHCPSLVATNDGGAAFMFLSRRRWWHLVLDSLLLFSLRASIGAQAIDFWNPRFSHWLLGSRFTASSLCSKRRWQKDKRKSAAAAGSKWVLLGAGGWELTPGGGVFLSKERSISTAENRWASRSCPR